MITLAAALLLAQGKAVFMTTLGTKDTPESMIIRWEEGKLDVPKIGPKDKLEYEFLVAGMGASVPSAPGIHPLRFRVFSQIRKTEDDLAVAVTRMALRLWNLNYRRLGFDHSDRYNNRVVDFYLSWGGEAGGEQLFTDDMEAGRERKVNVVYIFDLASFKDPVEMAREVAHEYGHATLPPIGGFKTPEDWGNGQFGEKIYLRWLRNDLAAGTLGPEDVMGVTLPKLDSWVKKNVDPLVDRVALNGPDFLLLRSEGQGAMDAYSGLALYAEQVLPRPVFKRSLLLTGSTNAADYAPAIIAAVAEAGKVTLSIADSWKTKDIWIPLGKGKVVGASVIKTSGDWALVRILNPAGIIISTTPPGGSK